MGRRSGQKRHGMSISKFLILTMIMSLVAFEGYSQRASPQAGSTQLKGRMELRVRDLKTKKFIYAGLGIYPVKVRHKPFASMSTATGDDGASHTIALLPGTYLANVERYLCNCEAQVRKDKAHLRNREVQTRNGLTKKPRRPFDLRGAMIIKIKP